MHVLAAVVVQGSVLLRALIILFWRDASSGGRVCGGRTSADTAEDAQQDEPARPVPPFTRTTGETTTIRTGYRRRTATPTSMPSRREPASPISTRLGSALCLDNRRASRPSSPRIASARHRIVRNQEVVGDRPVTTTPYNRPASEQSGVSVPRAVTPSEQLVAFIVAKQNRRARHGSAAVCQYVCDEGQPHGPCPRGSRPRTTSRKAFFPALPR